MQPLIKLAIPATNPLLTLSRWTVGWVLYVRAIKWEESLESRSSLRYAGSRMAIYQRAPVECNSSMVSHDIHTSENWFSPRTCELRLSPRRLFVSKHTPSTTNDSRIRQWTLPCTWELRQIEATSTGPLTDSTVPRRKGKKKWLWWCWKIRRRTYTRSRLLSSTSTHKF